MIASSLIPSRLANAAADDGSVGHTSDALSPCHAGAHDRHAAGIRARPGLGPFLRDPYPAHEDLREAGPAVLLEQYGVWAMARHAQVHEALGDWETYRSGAGVGLADFTKETPWRPPSLRLEADPPAHDRAAFEEVLRFESPVQTFFRTTTRAVAVDGVDVPAGEKVLLFLAAANRDPRHWDEPDRFDIARKASGHMGFGSGIHACVGRMVARMEGEVLLRALARRVKAIELDGEPERLLNNTLRGLTRLPMRIVPA
jgi:cytochrome P450